MILKMILMMMEMKMIMPIYDEDGNADNKFYVYKTYYSTCQVKQSKV